MLRCPICGTEAEAFRTYGNPPRPNAICSSCGAAERHRLAWVYLERCTDLFRRPRKRLFHVAPERPFRERLRHHADVDYLTADLRSRHADLRIDLTDIPMNDAVVDAVFCSHVLEHIPDDRRAIAELFRILKPGGWAILEVPLRRRTDTEEDPSLTPDQRLERYGQRDHVRLYGAEDYRRRLESAGFAVSVMQAGDFVGEADARAYAIPLSQRVHFCAKPPTAVLAGAEALVASAKDSHPRLSPTRDSPQPVAEAAAAASRWASHQAWSTSVGAVRSPVSRSSAPTYS